MNSTTLLTQSTQLTGTGLQMCVAKVENCAHSRHRVHRKHEWCKSIRKDSLWSLGLLTIGRGRHASEEFFLLLTNSVFLLSASTFPVEISAVLLLAQYLFAWLILRRLFVPCSLRSLVFCARVPEPAWDFFPQVCTYVFVLPTQ